MKCRLGVKYCTESKCFRFCVIGTIIFNSIMLASEHVNMTYDTEKFFDTANQVNNVILI